MRRKHLAANSICNTVDDLAAVLREIDVLGRVALRMAFRSHPRSRRDVANVRTVLIDVTKDAMSAGVPMPWTGSSRRAIDNASSGIGWLPCSNGSDLLFLRTLDAL